MITFDFDGTLTLEQWDRETFSSVYAGPNHAILRKLREFQDLGEEVCIVTSRTRKFENSPDRKSISKFLQEQNLKVPVVFTEGNLKRDTLIHLRSRIHFDNEEFEGSFLPSFIQFILVE